MNAENYIKSLNPILTQSEQLSSIKNFIKNTDNETVVDLICYYGLLNQIPHFEVLMKEKELENKDYVYILATFILNKSDYYILKEVAKHCYIDHTQDDILYTIFFYKNKEALDCVLTNAKLSVETIRILRKEMHLIKSWKEEDLIKLELLMFAFDLTNIENPRNLLYAVTSLINCDESRKEKYFERAMKLIRDGIKVNMWNNYILKLILVDFKDNLDKKYKDPLVKEILFHGGRITPTIVKCLKK